MEYYIINSEELKERGINSEGLEKAFDYITYDSIKIELENRGYKVERLTEEILAQFRLTLWSKEDSTRVEEIIDFLEYNRALTLIG